jgi:2-keto-4-pentenoate hydratase/2-oxohepta-3-ene-1,7-dioic acid hydratase in catechol pathway
MFSYLPTNYGWNLAVELALEMGSRIGKIGVMCAPLVEASKQSDAAGFIRLDVQPNDGRLRAFEPREMKRSFGFLLAKPPASFAPLAVTPAALPPMWEGHKAGRDNGYCHLEKLRNLDALPSHRFPVSCFLHEIRGASAGLTRAVAIL